MMFGRPSKSSKNSILNTSTTNHNNVAVAVTGGSGSQSSRTTPKLSMNAQAPNHAAATSSQSTKHMHEASQVNGNKSSAAVKQHNDDFQQQIIIKAQTPNRMTTPVATNATIEDVQYNDSAMEIEDQYDEQDQNTAVTLVTDHGTCDPIIKSGASISNQQSLQQQQQFNSGQQINGMKDSKQNIGDNQRIVMQIELPTADDGDHNIGFAPVIADASCDYEEEVEQLVENHDFDGQQQHMMSSSIKSQSEVVQADGGQNSVVSHTTTAKNAGANATPNSPPSRQRHTTAFGAGGLPPQNQHSQPQNISQATLPVSVSSVAQTKLNKLADSGRSTKSILSSTVTVLPNQSSYKRQKSDKNKKKSIVGRCLSGLSNQTLQSQHNSTKRKQQQATVVAAVDTASVVSNSGGSTLAKQNSTQQTMPSTLDPANPLSLTSVARSKKLPTQERSSLGNRPQQCLPISNFQAQLSVSQSQAILPISSNRPNKSFKVISQSTATATGPQQPQHNNSQVMQELVPHSSSSQLAMKYASNTTRNRLKYTSSPPKQQRASILTTNRGISRSSRQGGGLTGNSPTSSNNHMRKSVTGQNTARHNHSTISGSAKKKQQIYQKTISITNSQAMIEKSIHQRMNSGGRQMIEQNNNGEDGDSNQQMMLLDSSSNHFQTLDSMPFVEETMRDEVVAQLRQNLETERQKHREMKQIFEETMQNIESQNRQMPEEAIEMQASKAVEEIITHGAATKSALEQELEKQKTLVAEMKQRESDNMQQMQILEKKLLHAQMREKENQAQEQIRNLQQETEERKLKFEIERYKEQVKDLKNNEEQLKSDHAQKILELTDQTEEVRAKQAAEDEDRFMRQISEIKHAHTREKDTLVQQKFTATQELQMIKMDHSELIRNTNFEEQRELTETITAQQAQIQHLTIMMNEQQNNFELKESQLLREKKTCEQRVEQLESSLETAQNEKNAMQIELNGKCKRLEEQLEQATQDKEKAYKNQMEKIQENLESLKEQIQSTNQSLMDQTMHIPLAESSSLALGPVARLHSPDFRNPVHQRGEPISISSPRVPRLQARLQADRSQQRLQSPGAVMTTSRHQLRDEKAGEQRTGAGFMTGSEMQELTQMMSNGTAEQTMNLGAQTAGQALFNQTNGPAAGAQNNTNSFLMDPIFNDYYVEYVMLHKLQALTNNFTCQNCWQVLNFTKFFDEEHLCLHKVNVPSSSATQQQQVKHSQISGTEAASKELKEAQAAMFDGSPPRLTNHAVGENSSGDKQNTNVQQLQQNYNSNNSQRHQRSSSAYYKRGQIPNLPNLMKATAQAATGGVLVAEINLTGANEAGGRQTGRGSSQDPESRQIATGSFHQSQSYGQGHLETSIDTQLDNSIQRIVVQQASSAMNSSQQQVNQMRLHAYLTKIKEYRVTIVNLEEELRRCKQENESLIFDLRDSKTKVAMLEENKAQLQMELQRERKRQVKQTMGQAKVNAEQKMADQRSPRSPPALNLTVNTQSGGFFGMGGKSNLSVRVQPALNSQQKVQQQTITTSNGKIAISTAQIGANGESDDKQQQEMATPRSRFNQSEEKQRDRRGNNNVPKTLNKAVFRSPQSRMVPLSQKFSAFPTSEQKALGQSGFIGGASHTVSGMSQSNILGYTRNMDLSIQSCSYQGGNGVGGGGLASHRSLNNLTQQLNNSSVQNLRVGNDGCQTTRPPGGTDQQQEVMAAGQQQQYFYQGQTATANATNPPGSIKQVQSQQQRSMKDDVRLSAYNNNIRSTINLMATNGAQSNNNGQNQNNSRLQQEQQIQQQVIAGDVELQQRQSDQQFVLQRENSEYSRGNESCDISPDHDSGSAGRRHHAVAGGTANNASTRENNFIEEVAHHEAVLNSAHVADADAISSMNPLATERIGGHDGQEQRRISLFEEQQPPHSNTKTQTQIQQRRRLEQLQEEEQQTNDDPEGDESILSRSERMIKLNNPYDQVNITRQKQQRLSSNSPDNGTNAKHIRQRKKNQHHEVSAQSDSKQRHQRMAIFTGPTGVSAKIAQKTKKQQHHQHHQHVNHQHSVHHHHSQQTVQISLQQSQTVAKPPPIMIKNAVPLSKLAKMNSMGVPADSRLMMDNNNSISVSSQKHHHQNNHQRNILNTDQSLGGGNSSEVVVAGNVLSNQGGQPVKQTGMDEPLSVEEL